MTAQPQYWECPVCTGELGEPGILPMTSDACGDIGHMVCCACLMKIPEQTNATGVKFRHCPECRAESTNYFAMASLVNMDADNKSAELLAAWKAMRASRTKQPEADEKPQASASSELCDRSGCARIAELQAELDNCKVIDEFAYVDFDLLSAGRWDELGFEPLNALQQVIVANAINDFMRVPELKAALERACDLTAEYQDVLSVRIIRSARNHEIVAILPIADLRRVVQLYVRKLKCDAH